MFPSYARAISKATLVAFVMKKNTQGVVNPQAETSYLLSRGHAIGPHYYLTYGY